MTTCRTGDRHMAPTRCHLTYCTIEDGRTRRERGRGSRERGLLKGIRGPSFVISKKGHVHSQSPHSLLIRLVVRVPMVYSRPDALADGTLYTLTRSSIRGPRAPRYII